MGASIASQVGFVYGWVVVEQKSKMERCQSEFHPSRLLYAWQEIWWDESKVR